MCRRKSASTGKREATNADDGALPFDTATDASHEDVFYDRSKGFTEVNSAPVAHEDQAGFLSRLFVLWMMRPLRIAKTKDDLQVRDLGTGSRADEVPFIFARLKQYLMEENGNLSRALMRLVTIRVLVLGYVLSVLQAGLVMCVPFLAKMILDALTGESPLSSGELWALSIGVVLFPFVGAVSLSFRSQALAPTDIIPSIKKFCQVHTMLMSRRASLHMCMALSQLIYEKSLVKTQVSTGRLTNLISNDAGSAIERSVQLLFPLLISPIQLILLLWLLYRELGIAVLAGVGTVIILFPFNVCILARIASLNKHIMVASDRRQRLVSEFLTRIRTIKAYAWEDPLVKRIHEAREEELKSLKVHALTLNVGLGLLLVQLGNVMQVVILWTYYGTNGVFSPGIIFTAIQLFVLLQAPLSSLPSAVGSSVQTLTAIRRIQAFLDEPELCSFAISKDDDDDSLPKKAAEQEEEIKSSNGDVLVVMNHTSFEWVQRKDEESLSEGKRKKRTRGKKSHSVTSPQSTLTTTTVKSSDFALRDVCLRLLRGNLVAVVSSRLGGGKTCFLKALLDGGEVILTTGECIKPRRVSYAQQEPFLIQASVRENILFGSSFEEDRYDSVVAGCALEEDFRMFKGHDLIQVGENGATLSGGQMARISIARAIYAKTDLVLLDDPLSALDTIVADHIFSTLRSSPLVKDRVVVFTTNQIQRLRDVDLILSLTPSASVDSDQVGGGGQEQVHCACYADYDTFVTNTMPFLQVVAQTPHSIPDRSASAANGSVDEEENHFHGFSSAAAEEESDDTPDASVNSHNEMEDLKEQTKVPTVDEAAADELFFKEKTAKGAMSSRVFLSYTNSAGPFVVGVAIVTNGVYMMAPRLSLIVLAQLTSLETTNNDSTEQDTKQIAMYLGLYTMVQSLSLIMCIVSGIMMALVLVRSGRSIHKRLLTSVTASSAQFFDSTPQGRISNRFTKDIAVVDTQLGQFFAWTCTTGNMVLGALVAVAVATKGIFLGLVIPIFFSYLALYRFQRGGGVAIHRLESKSRAPVLSWLGETIRGRATIRAFGQESRYQSINIGLLGDVSLPYFLGRAGLPAFLVSILTLLSFVITSCVTFFVVFSGLIGVSDVGLALSSLSIIIVTMYFFFFIVRLSLSDCDAIQTNPSLKLQDFELQLNSVERIDDFIQSTMSEHEGPMTCPKEESELLKATEGRWPVRGEVSINNLVVAYNASSSPVLKNVTLQIAAGERIAIVGRTGSGKSTLMKSMLRIVEAREGSIVIDGVNIRTLGLTLLRSRIGLIPQEPVIFSGTIRYNLDPFGVYPDDEMIQVLASVGFTCMRNASSSVANNIADPEPSVLDLTIAEGGSDLSAGQRQLICFARALLKKSNLILLDEPSAAMDVNTDRTLQQFIRKVANEGRKVTTITIAHRLSSVMDSDRIVVLSEGAIVEVDTPHALLNMNGKGYLRDMYDSLPLSERLRCDELISDTNGEISTTTEEQQV